MTTTIISRPRNARRSRARVRRNGAGSPRIANTAPASGTIITTSTELLRSYKQAEVMAPDAKFEALQTTAGNALLFSISTDGVFFVTQEVPGQSTGWVKTDLAASLAAATPGTKAKTFAVAQSPSGDTIDLALAMTGGTDDALYLSLGNSASDTSWVSQPNWVAIPYDASDHPLSKVVINDIFIAKSSGGESIVVDVLRDPSSAVPVVFRYFIDSTKSGGKAWHPHDVAGDLDGSAISSCIGRRAGDTIDGIYTLGTIGGHSQLIFQPLYNKFNPSVAARPARLALPAGTTGSALVAVSTGDNTTDLFVAAGQTIYYFAADNQKDGASGIALLNDPVYEDVQVLFAYGSVSEVILWGLNRADQVFYTRCDRANVANGAAWSRPLPIVQGAEQLSPYVNRVTNGNTFFVHTGANQLRRATRANDTTTWRTESIILPASPDAKAVKSLSYTTRIQVTDAAKKPLAATPVQLSAQHRVGVYVNGLYTILDPDPIDVQTDALGAITVVEWIQGLRGTPLTAKLPDTEAASINPMAKSFAKASAFADASSLRGAQITAWDGTTRPLVPSTTSNDDLKVAATAFGQLSSAYQSVPADGSVKAHNTSVTALASPSFRAGSIVSFAVGSARPVVAQSVLGFGDIIESAAGDVLSWLEGAADYVAHIVKDAASDVWHFVVEIAGKVYGFVLDAVEKVVGALEAVYRAIKTAIEELIAFLEFLFQWKYFVRTKDVFKKILFLSFDVVLDRFDTMKSDFDGILQDVRSNVDNWAGLKGGSWQGGVENGGNSLGFMRSVTDVAEVLTAPAMFLYQHFIENILGSRVTEPGSNPAGIDAFNRALAAIENQGDVVIDAINRIKSELIDGSVFESLSLGDTLKKLAAIVADAFLNDTGNIVDALFDVLALVVRDGVAALDSPIWIPVISDILGEFGISIGFSLLDVFMMVAAIPATLIYRIAHGSAPFSDGDGVSDKILAANTLAELQAAFGVGRARTAAVATVGGTYPKIELDRTVYITGHAVAAIGSFISAALAGRDDYDMSLTAAGVVAGVAAATAAIFESPVPLQDEDMYRMSTATSVLTLLNKAAAWRLPKMIFGEPSAAQSAQASKVAGGVDAVIAFLALTPTCYHFQELASAPSGSPRSSAIVSETGNITSYLNRIVNFFAIVDDEPESKALLQGAAATLMVLYGGLQIAAAFIDPT